MSDQSPSIHTQAAQVSVIIPAYNATKYLAEAVASASDQTCPPTEILVIDDGSTDETAAAAEALPPPVRVLRQDNGGPAAAMNTGIEAATGTHLAFLDADDRWAPEKLELQLAALASPGREAVDMVFGNVAHFLSPDLTPEVAATLHCPADPMPAYSAGTLLITADTFDRVGLFDPRYRTGEFLDWFGRATDLGLRDLVLPEVVSYRRVHGDNHSRVAEAPRTGYPQVLKALIDRRRATERESGTDTDAMAESP